MFSFGDKDKEKLKENMEQIKEMVDNGDVPENSQQEPEEQLDESQVDSSTLDEQSLEEDFENQDFSQDDNFDQGWEPAETNGRNQKTTAPENNNSETTSTQNFGNNPPAEQQDTSQSQDKIERFEEVAEQTSSFDEPKPAQQPQNNQQSQEESFDQKFSGQRTNSSNQGSSSQTSSSSTPSAPSNDNIPKPPETKEIEVPEIEKGPLFLKRQKFRKARQMVEEMRYLSDQIQGTLNNLESGIQEDQKIEKDIRNMLHEFESSREEVQGIISPGEE